MQSGLFRFGREAASRFRLESGTPRDFGYGTLQALLIDLRQPPPASSASSTCFFQQVRDERWMRRRRKPVSICTSETEIGRRAVV
jgi:hypothetical protein